MSDDVHESRQAAILAAVADVAREGGGTVWVHAEDCLHWGDEPEGCTCDPEAIEVEGAH